MSDYLTRFKAAPASFKKSFASLAAAWLFHPIFIYSLFDFGGRADASVGDLKKMVVVSLSLVFFLFIVKKWARALVVVGSLFILINDIFYLLVTAHGRLSTLLCVAVALLTIMGMYWLFVKETRDYYTQLNPKTEPPKPFDHRA